jgi:lambda family phage portal protein
VELDIYSRARAFHLLTQHPGDDLPEVQRRRYESFSPEEIEHCFLVERAGQVRGIPWLAVSAKGLHMLDGYEEAELVASRTAASKMGFFTSEDGEGYTGDDTEVEADEEGVTREAPVMSAEPGTFEDITGYNFVPWDPQHPTGAFGEFVRANLRRIAGGMGVSYVALANDLKGVSWSSVRYAAVEDRDLYMMLQDFVIDHFLTPVFNHWLKNTIMAGRLKLPYRRLEKYQNVNWQPRRWKWVDPAKEAAGHEKDLAMGINSPQRISADSHGDLDEIFTEIGEAVALAKEKGILHLFPYLQGTKANAQTNTNPND